MSQDNIRELHVHIERGNRARELMLSEAFNEVCNERNREYFEQFMLSGPEDAATRETLYSECHAILGLQQMLTGWINQGESAALSYAEIVKESEEE